MLILTILTTTIGIPGIVHSHTELKNKKEVTESKLSELSSLKNTEYGAIEKSLKRTVSKNIEIKKKYDQIANTVEDNNTPIQSGQAYDLSYIWVTLGNYATENQCDLNIEVLQTDDTEDQNYCTCDIKFQIISSYDGAIEFINNITQDSEIGFIPENIKMHSEYQTVKGVDETTNQVISTKRLMLVTEFYKTNTQISKSSLLKVENEESNK
jgi:hypothetical protein